MEDKFYNDGFEDFLNEQVKNHRMYPSDSVWRNINQNIHTDKKWPALSIVAFLFLIATVTLCVYFSPKPNIFAIKPATATDAQNKKVIASTSPLIPSNNLDNNFPDKWNHNSVGSVTSQPQQQPLQENMLAENEKSSISDQNNLTDQNETAKVITVTAKATDKNPILAANNAEAAATNLTKVETTATDTTATKNKKSLDKQKTTLASSNTSANKEDNDKTATDKFLKEHSADLSLYTITRQQHLKNTFSYQLYVTPSVSFRQLREDPSINTLKENMGGPVALNYVADVNKIVRHKPGMGIEAGFNILYNISDVVRVKSGLQFNARQYSIAAYKTGTELASIALIRDNGVDTVNSLTSYRTGSGYSSEELANKYYQIAIPIGIEWQVFGNKRVQFNVSGSIQPTYLLNRNTYLLSTNLKNYTENTGIVRSFNLNSNIEAFMTFKVGDFKWQIGPQLRYQNYSTFIKDYPIREYLMDYGFKVGVSKLIR